MDVWKLLILTILVAVLLGCTVGVLIGKHQLKKQRPDYKALLTNKERIIYFACILLGAACIAIGFLYKPASNPDPNMQPGMEQEFGMDGELIYDNPEQAAPIAGEVTSHVIIG